MFNFLRALSVRFRVPPWLPVGIVSVSVSVSVFSVLLWLSVAYKFKNKYYPTVLPEEMKTLKPKSKKAKRRVVDEALQGFLGDVFWKDEDGYAEAVAEATGSNYNLVERKPALVLRPKYTNDAVFAMKAIEAGKKLDLWGKIPFTVCGGGHSELCCVDKAVLVHMKHMDFIEVNRDDQSVFIGAGVTLGQLHAAAAKHKLACPIGTYPSVGCGLVLQGGIGFMSRMCSLTVDNIREVRIVLPGGIKRRLNHSAVGEDGDPFTMEELFWAVRGAGPCFGIVTEITLSVYEVDRILQASVVKPLDFVPTEADYLAQCEGVLRKLPKHQQCDISLGFKDESARIGFFAKSLTGEAFSKDLTLNLEIAQEDIVEVSYANVSSGGLNLPEEIKAAGEKGDVQPYSLQAASGIYTYVRNILVDEVTVEGWRVLLNALKDAPSKLSSISLQQTGGKCRRKHDSAWGCRDFEFSVVILALWNGSSADARKLNVAWADTLWKAVKKVGIAKGTYSVDIDPARRPKTFKEEAIMAFGKESYEKLQKLKARVDPNNVIRGKYI